MRAFIKSTCYLRLPVLSCFPSDDVLKTCQFGSQCYRDCRSLYLEASVGPRQEQVAYSFVSFCSVLLRDILCRISLYKSWTPAEVHGTATPSRRAASQALQMELCFYLLCEYTSSISLNQYRILSANVGFAPCVSS